MEYVMFDFQYQRISMEGMEFTNNEWNTSLPFTVTESSLVMSEATISGNDPGKTKWIKCKDCLYI